MEKSFLQYFAGRSSKRTRSFTKQNSNFSKNRSQWQNVMDRDNSLHTCFTQANIFLIFLIEKTGLDFSFSSFIDNDLTVLNNFSICKSNANFSKVNVWTAAVVVTIWHDIWISETTALRNVWIKRLQYGFLMQLYFCDGTKSVLWWNQ